MIDAEVPDRYPYSAIIDRAGQAPDIRLPGGARVAAWFITNIEHYEYLPPAHPLRDPWPARPHPDVVNYARRDYGNRAGVWRMLDLFDEYGVRPTVSLNAAVLDHFPEVARTLRERQWDVMGHGIYNTRYVAGLSEDDERAMIEDALETVHRHLGMQITGWLGPALTTSSRTPELLAAAGVRYMADFLHDDEPLPLRVGTGELMSMPYSLGLNDSPVIGRVQHSARTFTRLVSDQLAIFLEEGTIRPKVLAICMHPYALSAPSRQRHLADLVRMIAEHPDVWVADGAQIADLYASAYFVRGPGEGPR